MKFRNPFSQADADRRHAEAVGLLKSIMRNQEKIMSDLTKLTTDVDTPHCRSGGRCHGPHRALRRYRRAQSRCPAGQSGGSRCAGGEGGGGDV